MQGYANVLTKIGILRFLSCPNCYRRVNNGCSQEKEFQDAHQAKKSGLEGQSAHPFQVPAMSCFPTFPSGLFGVR